LAAIFENPQIALWSTFWGDDFPGIWWSASDSNGEKWKADSEEHCESVISLNRAVLIWKNASPEQVNLAFQIGGYYFLKKW